MFLLFIYLILPIPFLYFFGKTRNPHKELSHKTGLILAILFGLASAYYTLDFRSATIILLVGIIVAAATSGIGLIPSIIIAMIINAIAIESHNGGLKKRGERNGMFR